MLATFAIHGHARVGYLRHPRSRRHPILVMKPSQNRYFDDVSRISVPGRRLGFIDRGRNTLAECLMRP